MFPAGKYLCGTIHLKSNLTLNLLSGAELLASRDEADFDPYEKLPYNTPDDRETTYFHYALLAGENVHDVTITGAGAIDGNRPKRGGPKTIALKLSQRIAIRGITIRNAPNYAISFLGCDYVDVDGVTILNGYADGIDPDASRYVRISNCFIDSWDDAICPKASLALGYRRATEHVTVTNCVLSTSCNHFKLGTESEGGFKNIALSNCVMLRRSDPSHRAAISGMSLESVDGAAIDGIAISNVTMQDVRVPIFIRLGNRGRGMDPPVPGSVANISISNVVATGATLASSITGLEGHRVRNVSLSDIQVTMAGGADKFAGLAVPEVPGKYPEATMFGELPAWAFYARHVEGLVLRNFKARRLKPDVRPAVIVDDVRELELAGLSADAASGPQPVLWFHNVVGALVQGSRLYGGASQFLRVTGAGSREISLVGNDLRRARQAVDLGSEVDTSVVAAER